MKWPRRLTLVRHDESAYNALKKIKAEDLLYQEFREAYEKDWRAARTKKLALAVKKKLALGFGDHNTPLSEKSGSQAEIMAAKLRTKIYLPEIIFVSPYERTWETFRAMTRSWPELKTVKTYEEERLREQEHGMSLLYNDKKVFFTLFPDQKELYDLKGPYWYRHPQGENVADVRERNRSWITTLIREFAGKEVLVVTHHLTILAIRANLERLSAEEFLRLDKEEEPINAGVTVYEGDEAAGENGKLFLREYNSRYY